MADLIPYATILAAKNGDAEAMQRILKHYAPYIAIRAKRPFYDELFLPTDYTAAVSRILQIGRSKSR